MHQQLWMDWWQKAENRASTWFNCKRCMHRNNWMVFFSVYYLIATLSCWHRHSISALSSLHWVEVLSRLGEHNLKEQTLFIWTMCAHKIMMAHINITPNILIKFSTCSPILIHSLARCTSRRKKRCFASSLHHTMRMHAHTICDFLCYV